MDVVQALTEAGGIARAERIRAAAGDKALRAAVARGDIVRPGRGWVAPPHGDVARTAAASVNGVVSHLSAAQHWRWALKAPPGVPTVTVPRGRHGTRGTAAEVHFADLQTHEVDGTVTSPLRTVVDCARTYDFGTALAVADSALRSGRLRRDDLLAAAARSPRTGRTRAVRVAERSDGRAAGPFESVLRAIAIDVPGLRVEPQQWVGRVGRVDLLDARLGLVVEAESWAFHSGEEAFRHDIRRYTALTRAGFHVVRFVWEDVMHVPERVHDVLADMVALLGPEPTAVRVTTPTR